LFISRELRPSGICSYKGMTLETGRGTNFNPPVRCIHGFIHLFIYVSFFWSFIPKGYVDPYKNKREGKKPQQRNENEVLRPQRVRCAKFEGWGPLERKDERKRNSKRKEKVQYALSGDSLLRLPRNPPVPGFSPRPHLLPISDPRQL